MYVRTLDTQDQSVIEVSVVAVDDVSPSSAGGLSEVRELVGVHAVVAPHCLTATEALTQLHIPAQGERGAAYRTTDHLEKNTGAYSCLAPTICTGYR